MVNRTKDIALSVLVISAIAFSVYNGFCVTDWVQWLNNEQSVMCMVVAVLPMVTIQYKYLFTVSVFAFAMVCSHYVHMVIKAPYNVIIGHSAIGLLSIIIGILVQKFYTNKRTTK